MSKLKTRKAIAKRFRLTKKGKAKSAKASKSHLLTGKPRRRKRALSQKAVYGTTQSSRIKGMLPYN